MVSKRANFTRFGYRFGIAWLGFLSDSFRSLSFVRFVSIRSLLFCHFSLAMWFIDPAYENYRILLFMFKAKGVGHHHHHHHFIIINVIHHKLLNQNDIDTGSDNYLQQHPTRRPTSIYLANQSETSRFNTQANALFTNGQFTQKCGAVFLFAHFV